ncbi:MAG: ComEC/Rec2 family competence protein, partial [Anaerolineae bacterium]|nr:ComEC/Rec2 family competence protein [Anaerolineae bacterium]
LVIAPRHFDGEFGSRIRAAGVLETPSSGDLFSYSDYLARADIFSLMPRAQVTLLAQPTGWSFRANLIAYKQGAEIAVVQHLPEPYASLLTGILLGDDKGLSPEVRDSFAETGAAHVIAISGFNMAILGGFVSRLLHRVRIKVGLRAAISVTVIIVYALFVG